MVTLTGISNIIFLGFSENFKFSIQVNYSYNWEKMTFKAKGFVELKKNSTIQNRAKQKQY